MGSLMSPCISKNSQLAEGPERNSLSRQSSVTFIEQQWRLKLYKELKFLWDLYPGECWPNELRVLIKHWNPMFDKMFKKNDRWSAFMTCSFEDPLVKLCPHALRPKDQTINFWLQLEEDFQDSRNIFNHLINDLRKNLLVDFHDHGMLEEKTEILQRIIEVCSKIPPIYAAACTQFYKVTTDILFRRRQDLENFLLGALITQDLHRLIYVILRDMHASSIAQFEESFAAYSQKLATLNQLNVPRQDITPNIERASRENSELITQLVMTESPYEKNEIMLHISEQCKEFGDAVAAKSVAVSILNSKHKSVFVHIELIRQFYPNSDFQLFDTAFKEITGSLSVEPESIPSNTTATS